MNPAAPHAAGREPGDYLGWQLDQVPDVPAPVLEAVRKVAATHQPQYNVAVVRREPDGGEHHMLASYFPIRLPSGRWLIGGLPQDVSYQRRIEQQLDSAVGSKLRELDVKVVGRDVTIHARASRFWYRRGVKRVIETLPGLSGYRTHIDVGD